MVIDFIWWRFSYFIFQIHRYSWNLLGVRPFCENSEKLHIHIYTHKPLASDITESPTFHDII